jgi:hypothetical protein
MERIMSSFSKKALSREMASCVSNSWLGLGLGLVRVRVRARVRVRVRARARLGHLLVRARREPPHERRVVLLQLARQAADPWGRIKQTEA